jgi:carboxypeptidase D
LINPCWDVYQVATTCPLLWDVLGFPGSFDYLPEGASIYFNRTEVQKAINAPVQEWSECSNGVLEDDTSPPSGLSVLPRVIEKNNRTIIGHGMLDFILLANGTLMTIQNMTWNGAQGFSCYPENDFFVPYHEELNLGSLGGAGNFGKWHTERGLTFVTIELSGHMVSLRSFATNKICILINSTGSSIRTHRRIQAARVPPWQDRELGRALGLHNAEWRLR